MNQHSPTPLIGVYPGTFDPITSGHRDLIIRALKIVDILIIGVAVDTAKTPLFTLEERVEMVREDVTLFNHSSERVKVAGFEGLLVDFAARNNAAVIIRGLRAVSDFEYEFQMSCMNSRLNSTIETIFLPASENTHFIASRFVKEIARLKGDITNLVSPHVAARLTDHFFNKN